MLELLPLLIPLGYLACVSFELGRIDVLEHRLPNKYTLRLFLLTTPAVVLAALLSGAWERFFWALVAGVATALLGLLLGATGGLGLGDVKLMVSLNMLLGWFSPWLVLVSNGMAVFVAAAVGAFRLIAKRASARHQVAFGPYLLAAFFMTASYAIVTGIY